MQQLPERVPVRDLMLDPLNPRLPEEVQDQPQAAILAYLYEHDVLNELAESYITNGFFPNEQLLVLRPDANGKRIVVEGNRRLGALKYLLRDDDAIAAGLPEHLNDPPPPSGSLEELRSVPVVELQDRDELASYLGFRHISGLKTWAPEAKARYLYGEVEKERSAGNDDPFFTVGRRVGSNALGVRNAYHAYNTLRVARDELGLRLNATRVLAERFGVWTRLLGTANAGKYMGLKEITRDYDSVVTSAASLDAERVSQVLDDLTPQPGRRRALLQDSRDVTDYSAVLANPAALKVLRQYERLDLAAEIANGSDFDNRLTRIREALQVATREVLEGVAVTPDSLTLADAIARESRSLLVLVRSNLQTDADDEL